MSTLAQAASNCFTADEARAAHFRTLQQEFNVAALNCRSIDPNDSSIASRYNVFVARFDTPLQSNASALRGHFKRSGGNLDRWMTQVANDAGQRVVTDPDYCQRASDILDKVLAQEIAAAEGLATETASYRMNVPVCADPSVRQASAKASDKPKAKAAVKPKVDKAGNKDAKAVKAKAEVRPEKGKTPVEKAVANN